MISKIDINSTEYKKELEDTIKFTDEVNEKFGFVYNQNPEVNKSTQMGLARNNILYGKRYCPCFMVVGEDEKQRQEADNRLCPCVPALEKEIPENGSCHCGIFCTKEFVSDEPKIEKAHSKGFTKDECAMILEKSQIIGVELEALLEARELGFVDFALVDVREWMEWQDNRIVGTNALIPTTSFYKELSQLDERKDIPIVLYCLTGSRSNHCMNAMRQMGYGKVINLTYGIVAYDGKRERG